MVRMDQYLHICLEVHSLKAGHTALTVKCFYQIRDINNINIFFQTFFCFPLSEKNSVGGFETKIFEYKLHFIIMSVHCFRH